MSVNKANAVLIGLMFSLLMGVASATHAQAAAEDAVWLEVRDSFFSWMTAWADKDVNAYIGAYVPDFSAKRGQTSAQWRAERRERLSRPGKISLDVSDLSVQQMSTTSILVRFTQAYSANHYSDNVRKDVLFVKTADGWKIQRETSR